MLIDYDDTKERMLKLIQEEGRTSDELTELVRKPTEDEDDIIAARRDLLAEKKIYFMYGKWKIVTENSLRNRDIAKAKRKNKPLPKKANPWAWYAMSPDNDWFREEIRKNLTREDGIVFRVLAAILTGEGRPSIGERTSGPITEEEGRYITQINKKLQAYANEREV